MVDTRDLKSLALRSVQVQVLFRAISPERVKLREKTAIFAPASLGQVTIDLPFVRPEQISPFSPQFPSFRSHPLGTPRNFTLEVYEKR